MTKLVLDCGAVQSLGDKFQTLSNEIGSSADSIQSYSIDDSDFDFASAKNSIALNVKGAEQKMKNTYKLVNLVLETHINLQNSLKFEVPSVQQKTSAAPSVAKTTSKPTSTYTEKSSYSSTASSNISSSSVGTSSVSVQNPPTNNITLNTENISDVRTINIPEGLGKQHTYMGWQMITSPSSNQYKFRETVGMNFDAEGFGRVGDRYVIACTSTFGEVGDLIDFIQSDGTIIKCVIGDIKSQQYTSYDNNPANTWGHNDGQCIVEFVVDKNTWYNTNHENPGNSTCHPEWNDYIVSATNYGSYYDIV